MHADQPVSYSFYIARIIRSILVAMHANHSLIMIQIIAIVERYRTSYRLDSGHPQGACPLGSMVTTPKTQN